MQVKGVVQAGTPCAQTRPVGRRAAPERILGTLENRKSSQNRTFNLPPLVTLIKIYLCRNIENQKHNWFRFRNQTRNTQIKNKTIGACKVEEQKNKISEENLRNEQRHSLMFRIPMFLISISHIQWSHIRFQLVVFKISDL